MQLEALIARGGAAGMPTLQNDPAVVMKILREQASMGLGRGAASLPVPPLNPTDPSHFGKSPIDAASVGANAMHHQVYHPDGRLSREGEHETISGLGSPAEYRARLDQILRVEEESALAGLRGLGGMPGHIPPDLLSRSQNPVGSPPVRVAEIRQALMRERAAAAATGRPLEDIFSKKEPKAKRLKKRR